MRLRLAPVEYKVCPTDEVKYEGSKCPQCGRPFDPTTVRKLTYDRLILVDVDPPVYEREARFRCSNEACKNLYEALKCPLCRTAKPQRPTIVWVRTFNYAESLEELQARE